MGFPIILCSRAQSVLRHLPLLPSHSPRCTLLPSLHMTASSQSACLVSRSSCHIERNDRRAPMHSATHTMIMCQSILRSFRISGFPLNMMVYSLAPSPEAANKRLVNPEQDTTARACVDLQQCLNE
jgi:hypothetical protein